MKTNSNFSAQQFKIDNSMKIGYVSLNVSDLQASVQFYESILGFQVFSRPSSERVLLSGSNNSRYLIELLQTEELGDNNSRSDPSVITNRAGLYHFAVLLPERKHLADMLRNLVNNRNEVYFDGLADHLVSESIYIRDPDYNGIEIYRDRPRSEWKWNGNQVQIATLPLNTEELLKESTEKGWQKMPASTAIGHVHLHVKDLSRAMWFYQNILGLNMTAAIPSAAFFAADDYHHHIATNTWLGNAISSANPKAIGLNHFSVELPNKDVFERTMQHLKQFYSQGIGPIDQSKYESASIQDSDGIRMVIQHN